MTNVTSEAQPDHGLPARAIAVGKKLLWPQRNCRGLNWSDFCLGNKQFPTLQISSEALSNNQHLWHIRHRQGVRARRAWFAKLRQRSRLRPRLLLPTRTQHQKVNPSDPNSHYHFDITIKDSNEDIIRSVSGADAPANVGVGVTSELPWFVVVTAQNVDANPVLMAMRMWLITATSVLTMVVRGRVIMAFLVSLKSCLMCWPDFKNLETRLVRETETFSWRRLALCLDDSLVIKWLRYHGILATSVYLLLIFSVI